MSRWLFGWSAVLAAGFSLVLGAFRLLPLPAAAEAAFGVNFQPPSQPCAMPCWYGLQPGLTPESVGLEHLERAGWVPEDPCNVAVYERCSAFGRGEAGETAFLYGSGGLVIQVALFPAHLTLSDLWLAFGAPDYALIPQNQGYFPSFDTAFWFGESGVSARLRVECPAGYRDVLDAPVRSVLMWHSGTAMGGSTGSISELRRSLRENCSA